MNGCVINKIGYAIDMIDYAIDMNGCVINKIGCAINKIGYVIDMNGCVVNKIGCVESNGGLGLVVFVNLRMIRSLQ